MIGTWRQQQAQETFQGYLIEHHGVVTIEAASAIADAVKIATTVKITRDALDAFMSEGSSWDTTEDEVHKGLVKFLTALGFEVVP